MALVKINFLGFPLVEELDIVGPFEVFGKILDVTDHDCELTILAPTEVVVCKHGLQILRTRSLDQKEGGTILVVPGGKGAREPSKERFKVVDFLRAAHAGYRFTLSVCTGTFLLDEAGILTNRVCTTHTVFQEELRLFGYCITLFLPPLSEPLVFRFLSQPQRFKQMLAKVHLFVNLLPSQMQHFEEVTR